ncbi:MAG: hypothetical protein Q7V88_05730 [Actinomycetota bacterium]|nr:hypothetical protein [Actinomycetota bacterium]
MGAPSAAAPRAVAAISVAAPIAVAINISRRVGSQSQTLSTL